MRLYVGSQGKSIQGEPLHLTGSRCWTAAHGLGCKHDLAQVNCLLDSGAFTDPPQRRLSPESALCRQLNWEQRTAQWCGSPDWTVQAIVSYDRLIDEVWTNGLRSKQRWSVKAADAAVQETVEAAHYLANQRNALAPRALVLSCQGVEATQYAECAAEVLSVARLGDWLGLGGWCILGLFTSWLPEFWRTLYLVLPMAQRAGLSHVHLFGVLYLPALGGLLWLADKLGLTVSTDSSRPILDCTRGNGKKAGVKATHWRASVLWWQECLKNLRSSLYYREPPDRKTCRQLDLF